MCFKSSIEDTGPQLILADEYKNIKMMMMMMSVFLTHLLNIHDVLHLIWKLYDKFVVDDN